GDVGERHRVRLQQVLQVAERGLQRPQERVGGLLAPRRRRRRELFEQRGEARRRGGALPRVLARRFLQIGDRLVERGDVVGVGRRFLRGVRLERGLELVSR